MSDEATNLRLNRLEEDVRDIRTTTVTHVMFDLRLSTIEGMVKRIVDAQDNARNRVMTHLILPVISGVAVALVVAFVIAGPKK